jgi:hypothetical protein
MDKIRYTRQNKVYQFRNVLRDYILNDLNISRSTQGLNILPKLFNKHASFTRTYLCTNEFAILMSNKTIFRENIIIIINNWKRE